MFKKTLGGGALAVALIAASFSAPTAVPLSAQTAHASTSGVVISEFRFRGPSGGNDEFIEIKNTGTSAANIGGWQIWGSNASGSSISARASVPTGVSLPAGKTFLFANSSTGGYSGGGTPDVTYTTGFTDNTGVQLRKSDGSTVEDAVGGNALSGAGLAFKEGTALSMSTTNTSPGNATSWQRKTSETQDTDNNATDFAASATASPTACGSDCTTVVGPSVTPIHDIQGSGLASPKDGQTVTVEGIVTGIDDEQGANFSTTFPEDAGVYVQAPESEYDANPSTSEGIFVGYVRGGTSAPYNRAALIGKKVRITGKVNEKFNQTIISEANGTEPTVLDGGASQTLPAPMTIDQSSAESQTVDSATGNRPYYERFEGMRVKIAQGIANSGGTSKFGELFLTPGTTKKRVFRTDPAPSLISLVDDAGANDPNNPYMRPKSSTLIEANRFADVQNAVGPMGFSYFNYTVTVQDPADPNVSDPLPTVAEDPSVPEPYTLDQKADDEIRAVSFNVENLFPVGADLDLGKVSQEAYDEKLGGLATAVKERLRSPEVIAVQEVGDGTHSTPSVNKSSADVLKDLADKIGGYSSYALEGNDNRGIDVGFLVKDGVVIHNTSSGDAVRQVAGLSSSGCSDVAGKLFDRPPLVIDVEPREGTRFSVISNHFASKSAPDSCREQQADAVRTEVESMRADGKKVLVMGDLNAFQDETPLDHMTQGGTLDNLWDGRAGDLTGIAPVEERYSFMFQGKLQTLDHALITDNFPLVRDFRYAHIGNDYFEKSSIGQKLSDHDPPVVTIKAPKCDQNAPRPLPAATLSVTLPAKLTAPRGGTSEPFDVTVKNVDATNKACTSNIKFKFVGGVTIAEGSNVGSTTGVIALGDLLPGESKTTSFKVAVSANATPRTVAPTFYGLAEPSTPTVVKQNRLTITP